MSDATDKVRKAMLESEQEVEEIFKEITTGSDRASAILAAAALELDLGQAILYRMDLFERTKVTEELLHDSGPFGNLRRKCLTAQALGIIDEGDAKRIDIIRVIRNRFAHSAKPLRFTSPNVATDCKRLLKTIDQHEVNLNEVGPREAYIIAVLEVHVRLNKYVARMVEEFNVRWRRSMMIPIEPDNG